MEGSNTLVLFAVIFSLALGFLIGYIISRIFISKENKIIEKNAREVLENQRDNVLEVDGIKYDATKFRNRNEEGDEIITDLKDGGIEKPAEKKEMKESKEDLESQLIKAKVAESKSKKQEKKKKVSK